MIVCKQWRGRFQKVAPSSKEEAGLCSMWLANSNRLGWGEIVQREFNKRWHIMHGNGTTERNLKAGAQTAERK